MQTEVRWKVVQYKADPAKVFNELSSMEAVTPEAVVEKARSKRSAMHSCFTWNNTKAAEQWRKQEARIMLCNLVIVKREEDAPEAPRTIRVFQKTETERGTAYKPTELIIRNEDEYAKLLRLAMAELKAFEKKYRELSELSELLEVIDSFIGELNIA